MEVLPRYQFFKGANLSPELKASISSYLDSISSNLPASDLVLPTFFKEEIQDLREFHLHWVRSRLGLDATATIAPLDGIKIYNVEGFSQVRARGMRLPNWARGVSLAPPKEIAVLLEDAPQMTFRNISHELVHTLNSALVKANQQGEVWGIDLQYGYASSRAFSAFEEVVTEMMNLDILHSLRQAGVDYLTNQGSGYVLDVLYMDQVLRALAERSGQDLEEIRFPLYVGRLRHDFSPLRAFTKAFGPDSLRMLSRQFPAPQSHVGTLANYLKKMEINAEPFIANLTRFAAGKHVEVLGQIPINIRPGNPLYDFRGIIN
jgi:hypothetical protein